VNICILGDARNVHIIRLASGLARRGIRLHVVTHKPGAIPGATVERFSVPKAGLRQPYRWADRRRRYLREFFLKFDVVNVHFLDDWALGGLLDDAGTDRADLIVTAWGSDIVDPPGETPASADLEAARIDLLRRADAVTACGPTFAGMVEKFAGLDSDSVRVVPFGVDTRLFRTSEEGAKARGLRGVVGFFKGFRPVYGAIDLIRAIPKVQRACPDVKWEMIGEGSSLDECQCMAHEAGAWPHVAWLPRQRHRELPGFLERWSISVIPSVHEAFGVAALESSAMEIPVVGSDVAGLRDTVVDGVTGTLVPPKNPEALADALIALVRDDSLRHLMGLAGRRRVIEQFEEENVLDQWVELYQTARERRAVMV